jgi:hypothetical protein
MDLIRTFGLTILTVDAPFREILKLRLYSKGFWIMAPGTAKLTAFQKYCRTNSRTIVITASLDIKYNPHL